MVIGVLALQGAFIEHVGRFRELGVDVLEVRTAEQLSHCAGIVLPGGESTAIALAAERCGLLEPLRAWVRAGRPVWGTCAGLILVAERAEGQKAGGQALVGGLDVTVSRNFFGAQSQSFESLLDIESAGAPAALAKLLANIHSFTGVFIRAPAILSCGGGVAPLAFIERAGERVCVAAANEHILATAFHPELTPDTAWHRVFARLVEAHTGALARTLGAVPAVSPIASGDSPGNFSPAVASVESAACMPTSFDQDAATSGNASMLQIARRLVPDTNPMQGRR